MFEVDFRPRRRSDARSERCSHLFVLWSTVVAIIVVVFIFLNYIWASVITVVLLIAVLWFTWYYFQSAPPETEPVAEVQHTAEESLSPSEIAEIPSFPYKRNGGAHEKHGNSENGGVGWLQCAVCIATMKEGEMVRQLPECKHVFHVKCIDKWLESHSTCPMCRVDVKSGKKPESEDHVPPV